MAGRFLAPEGLNLEQWGGFPENATPERTKFAYPDQWHLTAAPTGKAGDTVFVTVLRPGAAGKARLPEARRSVAGGTEFVTLDDPSGPIRAAFFTAEMDLSPRAALERAEWAHVYRVQPKIEIPITPIGPGADENPGMFTMLKAGTRFGAEAPPGEPDLVIAIRSRAPRAEHGRVTRLQYDLETGRVGHGDEWGQTPPAFRAWMRVADSRVPRREYGIARSEGRKVIAPLPEQSPDGTAP